MDKKQAADNHSCNPFIEGISNRASFLAGWEAREAQSPTDAVAFIEDAMTFEAWRKQEGWIYEGDGTIDKVWWKQGLRERLSHSELYKLFNPSGAAPKQVGVITKEQKIRFIWKVIEHFQEIRLNDDNCQDKEEWSDNVLSYNEVEVILYEMLEELDPKTVHTQSPAPQAAGLVWVKASERLPENGINKAARFNSTYINIRVDDEIINVGSAKFHSLQILLEWYPGIEWLDENSGQQVFTREDMEKAFYRDDDKVTFNFDEYMNTNYPNK